MNDSKYFANGFSSWMETHFEVVDYLSQTADNEGSMSCVARENGGRTEQYTLAETLTDAFEEQHKGEEWTELDFFDTIDAFLAEREAEHKEMMEG